MCYVLRRAPYMVLHVTAQLLTRLRRRFSPSTWAIVVAMTLGTAVQAADTIRVVPISRDGFVLVSFDLAEGFTDDVRAAIASGLRTTITYTVELRLAVPFWMDRTISSAIVGSTVEYDNLTRRHVLSRVIDGRVDDSKMSEDEDMVRTWLTALPRLPLFETRSLEPNREYYIKVSARTQPSNGSLPWANGIASGLAKFTFLP
jgi:hypothetical protein